MVNLLHIELLPSNPGPGWILTICTLVCAPTLWFSSDSIEVKLYRLLQLGAPGLEQRRLRPHRDAVNALA